MGFGSAGYTFFDPMARALIKAGASDEEKEQVLGDLIEHLQGEDWDTELDSLQQFLDDPAIVRAFAKHGITWPTDDEPVDSDSDAPAAEQGAPTDWQAVARRREQELKTVGEARHHAEQERDGAYRERAQLLAWLAALHPAVRTLAPDVTEPGWQILYINPTTGGQLSWHIAPRDIELFEHVEYLPANSGDERAVWDGHTTQAKYERIASLTRFLADVAEATGTPPCTCTFEAKCPNCRTEDGGAEQRVIAALDVIHEWQCNGEPNDYLTRVHRALAPPTSGTSTGPLATTEDDR